MSHLSPRLAWTKSYVSMQITSDTCRLVAANVEQRNNKHDSEFVICGACLGRRKQTALCNHNNSVASRHREIISLFHLSEEIILSECEER